MKRYRVKVTQRRTVEVEVESPDVYSAQLDAIHLVGRKSLDEAPLSSQVDFGTMRQLGEPWLHECGWCDLHGPGDVFICRRSIGNRFTREDVELLKLRIAQVLRVVVVDDWNGAGCESVSVRCRGRSGVSQITKEQSAAISAPRPEGTR